MKDVILLSKIPENNEKVDILGTRDAIIALTSVCSKDNIVMKIDKNYPATYSLVKYVYENNSEEVNIKEFSDFPANLDSDDIVVVIAGDTDIENWVRNLITERPEITILPIHNTGGAAKKLYKTLNCPEIEDTLAYHFLFSEIFKKL